MLLALQPGHLPKQVQDAFSNAAEFDLYSLDPFAEAKDGFHGYTVLGKTAVKGDLAKKVREAIEKGASENNDKKGACFHPRHGIRISTAKTSYDLVICFQCLQIEVYEGDKEITLVLTSGSPSDLLNKVLTDAGIPLPKK
jgi:hypothetical protein